MEKKIKALVVEPGKPPRLTRVEASEEAFRKIVGGPLEYGCCLPRRVMLFSREDGQKAGLPFNRTVSLDGSAAVNLYGTFLLCGFADDSYISLTIAQQKDLRTHFAAPLSGAKVST